MLCAQGVDPSSQLYYTAIESHVAAAFPYKWARWQLAAAAGLQAQGGRGGAAALSVAQPAHYTSHRMPLKSPVPTCGSAHGQQQQQQLSVQWAPSGHHDEAAAAAAVASGCAVPRLMLSQMLQHPQLGAGQGQQQQQQQLDRSLRQQLLQQYHDQQQQQQQQQNELSLPALRPSESPLPPDAGESSRADRRSCSASPQRYSPSRSPLQLSASHECGGLAALGVSQEGLLRSSHSSMYSQPRQQQQQQHNARPNPTGVSPAASRVLLESANTSFYDGSGPLTSGTKPTWHGNSQTHSLQAGADLAQVCFLQVCAWLLHWLHSIFSDRLLLLPAHRCCAAASTQGTAA